MRAASTLVDALEVAAERPEHGFQHVASNGKDRRFVPFADLATAARRVAGALIADGVKPGDRIALVLPESEEFVACLFGAMYAGAIPVPLYPPMRLAGLEGYLDNATHILRKAGCCRVVTERRVAMVLGTLLERVPELAGVMEASALFGAGGPTAEPSKALTSDTVAFLQFTSGTTSRPKGVMVSHGNLLANIDCIGAALGLGDPDDGAVVSWLPLFHDMGLIGFVFTPIRFRIRSTTFIPPMAFLKRPAIWLRTMSDERAHSSFAPNFAFGLCARRIKDAELEGVDLRCVRLIGCGAEPIQQDTLRAFADRFAPWGFSRLAFLPSYGMAEHTLAATFASHRDEVLVDHVDAACLSDGRVADATDAPRVDVVCCGRPLPGHSVRVVGDDDEVLSGGRVGHIELRGPSVMQGYWADEVATSAAMHDGWLRSGDLGYVRDGALYVCGRHKDLIILHGRNYYPSDVESIVGSVAGVRRGNVVAFGVQDRQLGRERVIVAAEVRESAEPDLHNKIIARVLEGLSLKVDEVLLLPPRTLPKTSSGKLQRIRTQELYLTGELLAPKDETSWHSLKHLMASQLGYLKAHVGRRFGGGETP